MRLLPLAALVLLSRAAARAEDLRPAEPEKPKCEALLAEPRPEKPEERAAWDACANPPGAARGAFQAVPASEEARREETAAQGVLAAQTRMRSWGNPFAPGASAGDPAGTAGRPGSADPGLYTSLTNSAGAGGRVSIDRSAPPPSRVGEAFAALEEPRTPGGYVLAASAAWKAAAPQPWAPVMDWTSLVQPLYAPVEVRPAEKWNLATPASASSKKPTKPFVPADAPNPLTGSGVTTSGFTANTAKDLKAALPSMGYKAMVNTSALAALGAAPWIKAITVDYKPQADKRHDGRAVARVDVGEGALTGFISTGYEESAVTAGKTPKGKAVVNEKTIVPVQVGLTYTY